MESQEEERGDGKQKHYSKHRSHVAPSYINCNINCITPKKYHPAFESRPSNAKNSLFPLVVKTCFFVFSSQAKTRSRDVTMRAVTRE